MRVHRQLLLEIIDFWKAEASSLADRGCFEEAEYAVRAWNHFERQAELAKDPEPLPRFEVGRSGGGIDDSPVEKAS